MVCSRQRASKTAHGFENSEKLFSISKSCFSYATFRVFCNTSLVPIFKTRGFLELSLGSDSRPALLLAHCSSCALLCHRTPAAEASTGVRGYPYSRAFWWCFVPLIRLIQQKWTLLPQFKDALHQWSCIPERPCAKRRPPSSTCSVYTLSLLQPSAEGAVLLRGTVMKEARYLLETLEQSKQIYWVKVNLKVA